MSSSPLKETTTYYENDQQQLNEEDHSGGIYFMDPNVANNNMDDYYYGEDDDPYAFYDQILNHGGGDDDEMYDNFEEQEAQHQGEQQSAYDYQQDALLHLIVGVQSYLSDLSCSGLSNDQQDSPLNDLQYKMYTYLKRRAHDMGVIAENPVSNT
ncbi:hypothetical protein O0I10_002802 [Lichtheimia ornata]|uniref:Uncharacterized protein n=1 Tax=Lichtheimia ornata TaxID=688661 RepID=A0AAD7Y0I6_9FUNG|nr:uncharacterized protein O0I10_002802 [Lichtheimia ornata]KAJ8661535.1 hypothetical protein O0I10_002802 [Lichtheimia ornata]